MNRTDELTARLLDGILTDAEAVELDGLLAGDPAALGRHLELADLEANLRGLRADLDLAGPTVGRIVAARAERAARGVMAEVAAQPAPAWRGRAGRPRPRRAAWLAVAAVAAAVLLGVGLHFVPPGNDTPPPDPSGPAMVRLTKVAGAVELLMPDGKVLVASPGDPLFPGQTVRTVGDDSEAVVEFPDRSRVEMEPETVVRLDGENGGGRPSDRQLFLSRGQISAVVTPRPDRLTTVVGTAAADVVARHGRFTLASAESGSVRVELQDGDVTVVRANTAGPVALSPGRAAFIREGVPSLYVESPSRVGSTPRDMLDFPAAYTLAFTPDGQEVWAASARQWVRWRPDSDDPAAVVRRERFAPPVKNDGHLACLAADLRTVTTCGVDDREGRLLVRDLPSGSVRHVLPVRVTEPNFLAAAPDGGWVATTGRGAASVVRVWDPARGREEFTLDVQGRASCLAATPDGGFLAVGVADPGRDSRNKVAFYDPATGERAFSLPTQRRWISALAFSRDGRFLAAGFEGLVQVWDVRARKLVRSIDGFERVVTALAFSADGKHLAAGTKDGQAWVWAADTGRRVQVVATGSRHVRAIAFRPDGKAFVTSTNRAGVALWDVAAEPDA